jgi:hypothetical protein
MVGFIVSCNAAFSIIIMLYLTTHSVSFPNWREKTMEKEEVKEQTQKDL